MVNCEPCVIDYEPCLLSCCDGEDYTSSLKGFDSHLVTENPNLTGEPYKLVKGDVIQIAVFDDSELNVDKVAVAPDGNIYYANLDAIEAEGRSLAEVRGEIKEQLKELIVDPTITLNLVLANDYTFTILGKVVHPGVYPIVDSLRLREAIGLAGGLEKERYYDKNVNAQLYDIVDLEKSFIVRDGEKIKPDFVSLLRSCSDSQNMYIKPGDYIFLSPQEPNAIYLVGSAILPNRIPYYKDITISEVIAKGKGWSTMQYQFKAANLSKVLIIRGSLECPRTVEVDIQKILYGEARDFHLMPGDIVYLQNKEMRFGRELVNLAIRTFLQSFGFSAGRYWGEQWFPNTLN